MAEVVWLGETGNDPVAAQALLKTLEGVTWQTFPEPKRPRPPRKRWNAGRHLGGSGAGSLAGAGATAAAMVTAALTGVSSSGGWQRWNHSAWLVRAHSIMYSPASFSPSGRQSSSRATL
jgi:hypothetical protein